jgi:putative DNA primase/helicase
MSATLPDEIARGLGGATKTGGGWNCKCPCHDDGKASLHIEASADGKILVHCHAGCAQADVIDELKRRGLWPGRTNGDAPPPRANGHDKAARQAARKVVETYDYVDEGGELLFQALRYKPKSFSQRRRDETGGWVYSLGECRRVLYRLPDVIEAARHGTMVIICEGERDADALRCMDFCATTSPMGAGKWRPEYSESLRGVDVVILPDNDAPGRKHGDSVAASLTDIAASVRVLALPGLEQIKGGDASDWIAAGGTAEELRALIKHDAKPWAARNGHDRAARGNVQEIDLLRGNLHDAPAGRLPDGDGKPVIPIVAGEVSRIINQIEEAVLAADLGLYQRNGCVVRIETAIITMPDAPKRSTLVIRTQEAEALREDLCKAARFMKYDKRNGEWIACDPPIQRAKDWIARRERLRLSPLTGVTSSPLILPEERRIISKQGYDAGTGLFFEPLGASFPPVPTHPTRTDALAALDLLRTLLVEFPFADGQQGASESVMLSAIISAIMRPAIGNTPLHAFNAPAARTGKSLAATLVSVIAHGRAPPLCTAGKTEEELEKRIDAILLESPPFFLIDNIDHPLESAALCVLLTQEDKCIRPLGTSTIQEITVRPFVECTGNNLVLVGDLVGRAIRCTLNAKIERPEFREIRRPTLLRDVKKDRGRYAVAALTIVQAFICTGSNSINTARRV